MNPYEILGVSRDATLVDIKVRYKSLAQKHHPDREGGDAELFAQISEAYEILRDPKMRKLYDETGSTEKVPDLDHRAMAEIMTLFDKWLEAVMQGQRNFNEDVVEFMDNQFEVGISRAGAELVKLQNAKERAEQVLEKFKSDDDNDTANMLNGHIGTRIASVQKQIDGISASIEQMTRAKELLQHVTYDHDKGIAFQQPHINMGRTTTSTGSFHWG